MLNHGSLLEDFEPSVNPPAEIDDPEDFKPSDWDEREKIPGQFFNKKSNKLFAFLYLSAFGIYLQYLRHAVPHATCAF